MVSGFQTRWGISVEKTVSSLIRPGEHTAEAVGEGELEDGTDCEETELVQIICIDGMCGVY